MKKPSIFEKFPNLELYLKLLGVMSVIVTLVSFLTTQNVVADSNKEAIKGKASSKEMALVFEKIAYQIDILNDQNKKQLEINENLKKAVIEFELSNNNTKYEINRLSDKIDLSLRVQENIDNTLINYVNWYKSTKETKQH